MKIVFFGTPVFAAKILESLLEASLEIVAVVTQPDRPKGRSQKIAQSAVKEFMEHWPKIPVFQPEKASSSDFVQKISEFHPELFVVVAYGEIMRKALLSVPKKAAINVHASLLPKYRGAAPIQHCLLNGETQSGVSIMHMVREMDAGNVIRQDKVLIKSDMNADTLQKSLWECGAQSLMKVLRDFTERGVDPGLAQNHESATFAHKITSNDAKIDWNKPASQIERTVRAMDSRPGAWCEMQMTKKRIRIKIFSISLIHASKGMAPGQIVQNKGAKLIVAAKDKLLEINILQVEGKKKMTSREFLLGLQQANQPIYML